MTEIDLQRLNDCISRKMLLDPKKDLVWKLIISRNKGFRHDLIKTYLNIEDEIVDSEMLSPILLPPEATSLAAIEDFLKSLPKEHQSKVYITDTTVLLTLRNLKGDIYTMIVFLEMQNYYDPDYTI